MKKNEEEEFSLNGIVSLANKLLEAVGKDANELVGSSGDASVNVATLFHIVEGLVVSDDEEPEDVADPSATASGLVASSRSSEGSSRMAERGKEDDESKFDVEIN